MARNKIMEFKNISPKEVFNSIFKATISEVFF